MAPSGTNYVLQIYYDIHLRAAIASSALAEGCMRLMRPHEEKETPSMVESLTVIESREEFKL
jgi:hypothetical protein